MNINQLSYVYIWISQIYTIRQLTCVYQSANWLKAAARLKHIDMVITCGLYVYRGSYRRFYFSAPKKVRTSIQSSPSKKLLLSSSLRECEPFPAGLGSCLYGVLLQRSPKGSWFLAEKPEKVRRSRRRRLSWGSANLYTTKHTRSPNRRLCRQLMMLRWIAKKTFDDY
jgi:hypothetical protein